MNLEALWYAVIAISVLLYAVLDGFDLGVGALHLFAKGDLQRRMFLNAIGPVWDGNEVWIVIVMGGLFAGFPNAYGAIFSGFYSLLMILIPALMFRAAAIEFRSKRDSLLWRQTWDIVFSFASILVAFVLGVLMGNAIIGVPIDAEQNVIASFRSFFSPYAILVGMSSVALFAMHGASYLAMKTEGETQEELRKWIFPAILSFLGWFFALTLATFLYMPHMMLRFETSPWFILFPFFLFLCIALIVYFVKKKKEGTAFFFSSLSIASLLVLYGIGTYPTILPSTISPETNSLTIYNSASSAKTLQLLLIIVCMGVPLVLGYGYWIYRIFRGKVRLEKSSY